MGALIGMAFVASVVVGSSYFLSKFLPNFNVGDKRIKRDLNNMKQEIQEDIAKLAPWTIEERSLMSIKVQTNKRRSGITKSYSGQFNSIYHEPLIVWRMKEYAGGKLSKLIYARTSHQEFTFRVTKQGIDVAIGDYYVGIYKNNHTLYTPQKGDYLGKIEKSSTQQHFPVYIKEREVAHLSNPKTLNHENSRAYGLIADMSEQEEALFIAMTLLEMMKFAKLLK